MATMNISQNITAANLGAISESLMPSKVPAGTTMNVHLLYPKGPSIIAGRNDNKAQK